MKNNKGKIDTPTAIVIAGLLIALGIYVSNRGFSLPQKNEQGTPAGIATTPELAPVVPIEVDIKGKPSLGDENAPVTIVEFSSYSCGHCGNYHRETFPKIKEKYIDTGKVRYVYRNFPFDGPTNIVHNAFECANEQGKFWEYIEVLFNNQKEQDKESLKNYAIELGMDGNKFTECIDTSKFEGEIEKDINDGLNYGVGGTPSFFINGYLLVGAQPYEEFEKMIEEQLSK